MKSLKDAGVESDERFSNGVRKSRETLLQICKAKKNAQSSSSEPSSLPNRISKDKILYESELFNPLRDCCLVRKTLWRKESNDVSDWLPKRRSSKPCSVTLVDKKLAAANTSESQKRISSAYLSCYDGDQQTTDTHDSFAGLSREKIFPDDSEEEENAFVVKRSKPENNDTATDYAKDDACWASSGNFKNALWTCVSEGKEQDGHQPQDSWTSMISLEILESRDKKHRSFENQTVSIPAKDANSNIAKKGVDAMQAVNTYSTFQPTFKHKFVPRHWNTRVRNGIFADKRLKCDKIMLFNPDDDEIKNTDKSDSKCQAFKLSDNQKKIETAFGAGTQHVVSKQNVSFGFRRTNAVSSINPVFLEDADSQIVVSNALRLKDMWLPNRKNLSPPELPPVESSSTDFRTASATSCSEKNALHSSNIQTKVNSEDRPKILIHLEKRRSSAAAESRKSDKHSKYSHESHRRKLQTSAMKENRSTDRRRRSMSPRRSRGSERENKRNNSTYRPARPTMNFDAHSSRRKTDTPHYWRNKKVYCGQRYRPTVFTEHKPMRRTAKWISQNFKPSFSDYPRLHSSLSSDNGDKNGLKNKVLRCKSSHGDMGKHIKLREKRPGHAEVKRVEKKNRHSGNSNVPRYVIRREMSVGPSRYTVRSVRANASRSIIFGQSRCNDDIASCVVSAGRKSHERDLRAVPKTSPSVSLNNKLQKMVSVKQEKARRVNIKRRSHSPSRCRSHSPSSHFNSYDRKRRSLSPISSHISVSRCAVDKKETGDVKHLHHGTPNRSGRERYGTFKKVERFPSTDNAGLLCGHGCSDNSEMRCTSALGSQQLEVRDNNACLANGRIRYHSLPFLIPVHSSFHRASRRVSLRRQRLKEDVTWTSQRGSSLCEPEVQSQIFPSGEDCQLTLMKGEGDIKCTAEDWPFFSEGSDQELSAEDSCEMECLRLKKLAGSRKKNTKRVGEVIMERDMTEFVATFGRHAVLYPAKAVSVVSNADIYGSYQWQRLHTRKYEHSGTLARPSPRDIRDNIKTNFDFASTRQDIIFNVVEESTDFDTKGSYEKDKIACTLRVGSVVDGAPTRSVVRDAKLRNTVAGVGKCLAIVDSSYAYKEMAMEKHDSNAEVELNVNEMSMQEPCKTRGSISQCSTTDSVNVQNKLVWQEFGSPSGAVLDVKKAIDKCEPINLKTEAIKSTIVQRDVDEVFFSATVTTEGNQYATDNMHGPSNACSWKKKLLRKAQDDSFASDNTKTDDCEQPGAHLCKVSREFGQLYNTRQIQAESHSSSQQATTTEVKWFSGEKSTEADKKTHAPFTQQSPTEPSTSTKCLKCSVVQGRFSFHENTEILQQRESQACGIPTNKGDSNTTSKRVGAKTPVHFTQVNAYILPNTDRKDVEDASKTASSSAIDEMGETRLSMENLGKTNISYGLDATRCEGSTHRTESNYSQNVGKLKTPESTASIACSISSLLSKKSTPLPEITLDHTPPLIVPIDTEDTIRMQVSSTNIHEAKESDSSFLLEVSKITMPLSESESAHFSPAAGSDTGTSLFMDTKQTSTSSRFVHAQSKSVDQSQLKVTETESVESLQPNPQNDHPDLNDTETPLACFSSRPLPSSVCAGLKSFPSPITSLPPLSAIAFTGSPGLCTATGCLDLATSTSKTEVVDATEAFVADVEVSPNTIISMTHAESPNMHVKKTFCSRRTLPSSVSLTAVVKISSSSDINSRRTLAGSGCRFRESQINQSPCMQNSIASVFSKNEGIAHATSTNRRHSNQIHPLVQTNPHMNVCESELQDVVETQNLTDFDSQLSCTGDANQRENALTSESSTQLKSVLNELVCSFNERLEDLNPTAHVPSRVLKAPNQTAETSFDERLQEGENMISSLLPLIKSRHKTARKKTRGASLTVASIEKKTAKQKSFPLRRGVKRTGGKGRGRPKRRKRLPSISSDEDIIEELNTKTNRPLRNAKGLVPESDSEEEESDHDLVSFMAASKESTIEIRSEVKKADAEEMCEKIQNISHDCVVASENESLDSDFDDNSISLRKLACREHTRIKKSSEVAASSAPYDVFEHADEREDDENIFTKLSRELEQEDQKFGNSQILNKRNESTLKQQNQSLPEHLERPPSINFVQLRKINQHGENNHDKPQSETEAPKEYSTLQSKLPSSELSTIQRPPADEFCDVNNKFRPILPTPPTSPIFEDSIRKIELAATQQSSPLQSTSGVSVIRAIGDDLKASHSERNKRLVLQFSANPGKDTSVENDETADMIAAAAEIAGVTGRSCVIESTTPLSRQIVKPLQIVMPLGLGSQEVTCDEHLPVDHFQSMQGGETKTGQKRITISKFSMPEMDGCHGFLEVTLSAPANRTYSLRRIPYVKAAPAGTEAVAPKSNLNFHGQQSASTDSYLVLPTSSVCATYLRLRDLITLIKVHPECLFSLMIRCNVTMYSPNEYARRLYAKVYDPVSEVDVNVAKMTLKHHRGKRLQNFLDHMIVLDNFLHSILPIFYFEAIGVKFPDVAKFVTVKIFKPVSSIDDEIVKMFRTPYEYNSELEKNDDHIECHAMERRRFSKYFAERRNSSHSSDCPGSFTQTSPSIREGHQAYPTHSTWLTRPPPPLLQAVRGDSSEQYSQRRYLTDGMSNFVTSGAPCPSTSENHSMPCFTPRQNSCNFRSGKQLEQASFYDQRMIASSRLEASRYSSASNVSCPVMNPASHTHRFAVASNHSGMARSNFPPGYFVANMPAGNSPRYAGTPNHCSAPSSCFGQLPPSDVSNKTYACEATTAWVGNNNVNIFQHSIGSFY